MNQIKILFTLVFSLFLTFTVLSMDNENSIYEEALEKIKEEKLEQAIELFLSIEDQNTDNYQYYYDLGYCYYRLEDDITAQDYFKKSISLNSEIFNPHKFLGLSYFYTNQYILSEIEFAKCIEIDDSDYYPYFMIGKIKEIYHEYDSAEEYHVQALKYNPEDFYVNYALANIYFDTERFDEAKGYFETCDSIDNEIYPVVSCLIQINYKLNDHRNTEILKSRLRKIKENTDDERIRELPWFTIDSYKYEDAIIIVQEAFNLTGDLYYHWVFNIYDTDRNFIKRVNLESSLVLRELGTMYIVGIEQFKNNRRIHQTTGIGFTELPDYTVMKKIVWQEISEGLEVGVTGSYIINE
ncbi:tetratricopeptide repeat protein [Breznakiella homolactica]|uniref:Tetratricopeptide repeat protein n=1 Tax=Breznakiella homolactica TaxID=2798577 RepID=A0A7T7XP46_9SPIR|nr:tetratricopeptide repeat protein [Breznakiella homolactica]QQO09930.1 tetratricopeptide repeat protein [Breznakiella homolactica]